MHILVEFSKKTIQIIFLKITMTSVDLIDILIRNLHIWNLWNPVILYALRTKKYSMPSPVLVLKCTNNNAIKYINNTKKEF